MSLDNCSKACTVWAYPYNGNNPLHDVFQGSSSPECSRTIDASEGKWTPDSETMNLTNVDLVSNKNKNCDSSLSGVHSLHTENSEGSSVNYSKDSTNPVSSTGTDDIFTTISDISATQSTIPDVSEVLRKIDWTSFDDTNASTEDISEFLDHLREIDTPPEDDSSIQTSMQSLSSVFSKLRSLSNSRTSTPCTDKRDFSKQDDSSVSKSLSFEKSSDHVSSLDRNQSNQSKSSRDSEVKVECENVTTFEVIDPNSQAELISNRDENVETSSKTQSTGNKSSSPQDATSYIEITMSSLSHANSLPVDVETLPNLTLSQCSDVSNDGSFKRSVSFSLPTMQTSVMKVPSGTNLSNTANIGKYCYY
jgi:hypothetical protein